VLAEGEEPVVYLVILALVMVPDRGLVEPEGRVHPEPEEAVPVPEAPVELPYA